MYSCSSRYLDFIHVYFNLQAKVSISGIQHLEDFSRVYTMDIIVHIKNVKEFVHHVNKLSCFRCLLSSCQGDCF